jgi:hypothetical protein
VQLETCTDISLLRSSGTVPYKSGNKIILRTSWRRVLLEKLIVVQLVKTSISLYGARGLIIVSHPLVANLKSWIQYTPSHFVNIHFNIIFAPKPMSAKLFLLSTFRDGHFVPISQLSHAWGWKSRGPWNSYPNIWLERLNKATKYLSQDGKCPGRESNRELPNTCQNRYCFVTLVPVSKKNELRVSVTMQ